jgi:iron complex outermembrane receptor protein
MKSIVFVSLIAVGLAAARDAAPSQVAAAAEPRAPGVVMGTVTSATGSPVGDAHVELVEIGMRTESTAEGRFRFEGVPGGAYLLQVQSPRAGINVARIEVAAGETLTADVTLDRATHAETVVVTATPLASALSDVVQPVSILTGSELAERMQPTLGETLAQQPGVSSTYFGPGASRPVIRGLGGDRIRVLQSGLGAADASSTSPDHAVSFDPLGAEQIEVVRGPATLLYGSNAVGGVVNILDDRVPDAVSDRPVHGKAEVSGGTVADERAGAVSLNGGAKAFAWHADFLKRKTDDLRIPGFAESAALRAEEAEEAEEHEQVQGTLENSAVENTSGAAGVSVVGRRGFLGVAFSGLDSLYGVPGHEHHEEEGELPPGEEPPAEEEGAVRIDLRQRRADLRGELRQPTGGVRNVRLRVGRADYEHTELEGDEIGTVFTNDSWEGRLELNHEPLGPFTGSFGVQGARRDFAAIGAEAFVPPTVTDTLAVFAFEEARSGAWRFQVGGRYEHQSAEVTEEALERTFGAVSGSGGVVWQSPASSAGLTVARSIKLPNAEELFSNGPHLATAAFEIGDADLGREKSLGVDLSLRRRSGRVTGDVNLFMNRFDGFIFEDLTGEEEDGLQVVRFVQRDADFRGVEAQLRVELLHAEPRHLDLDLMADYVHAELRDSGDPLPRIPPLRYGAALHYEDGPWSARVELRGVAEQDRVTANERPTDGYALLNATLGRRLFVGRTVIEALLRGTNLTDQEARNHVSFLKDIAPLPGRDVRLAVRVVF